MNKPKLKNGNIKTCQCLVKERLHSGLYEDWEDWIEHEPDWMEIRDYLYVARCVSCGKKTIDWESFENPNNYNPQDYL